MIACICFLLFWLLLFGLCVWCCGNCRGHDKEAMERITFARCVLLIVSVCCILVRCIGCLSSVLSPRFAFGCCLYGFANFVHDVSVFFFSCRGMDIGSNGACCSFKRDGSLCGRSGAFRFRASLSVSRVGGGVTSEECQNYVSKNIRLSMRDARDC